MLPEIAIPGAAKCPDKIIVNKEEYFHTTTVLGDEMKRV